MKLNELRIVIRGAGDLASAIGWRFTMGGFQVIMIEAARPLAVRRRVSFCEAVWDEAAEVQGLKACRIERPADAGGVLKRREIPILVDPNLERLSELAPHVLVDAVLAKKNLGVRMDLAPLVIGVGPGFCAGRDVHMVVESKRGHNLGRVLTEGEPAADTGVPGVIEGYAAERVLRAPADGVFEAGVELGAMVSAGQTVAEVAGIPLQSEIGGLVRGLIRPGLEVKRGMKVGDVDPRGDITYLDTISDKGLAVAGGVLEAVCRVYNR
ncbi:MAG: selenium-dependent molybdenum cofactor biosynthesis protein YqeB [Thermodesulfobacteriota bacterium]